MPFNVLLFFFFKLLSYFFAFGLLSFVSLLMDMFISVHQGDKALDTLRQWLKTYGRELDQETRRDCSETEKLLKRALTGAGGTLFSNLREFGFMYHSFTYHTTVV